MKKQFDTLSEQCLDLLQAIEQLPASPEATNLSILCGDLHRDILLGDMPRGEWTPWQRELLGLPMCGNIGGNEMDERVRRAHLDHIVIVGEDNEPMDPQPTFPVNEEASRAGAESGRRFRAAFDPPVGRWIKIDLTKPLPEDALYRRADGRVIQATPFLIKGMIDPNTPEHLRFPATHYMIPPEVVETP